MSIKKFIGFALIGALLPCSLPGAIQITIYQSGADIVIEASGTANTTDLTAGAIGTFSGYVNSSDGIAQTAEVSSNNGQLYTGISGPGSYAGTANRSGVFFSSGDTVGIRAVDNAIVLPTSYVSEASLSGASTAFDMTLAAIGLVQGTNVTWTWGSGGNADSLNLKVIPEPSTYAALMGLGAVALVMFRRKRV